MIRWATAALLMCPATALAIDPGWSIGGHFGTRFAPNAYPVSFPGRIDSYDFDDDGGDLADDVDADGVPDATTLEGVRGDFQIGAEANRWIAGLGRFGIAGDLDAGTRFTEVSMLFTYEKAFDVETMLLVAGGGIGFGSATWRGTDDDERLRLPNYPFRAQAGVMQRITPTLALQGRVFGQVSVPASHHYRDVAGHDQDVSGMALLYTTLGIQVGLMYGDFGGGLAAADRKEPAEAVAPADPPPVQTPPAAPPTTAPPIAPPPIPPPATPPAAPPAAPTDAPTDAAPDPAPK